MAFYPKEKIANTLELQDYVTKKKFFSDIDHVINNHSLKLNQNLKMNNNQLHNVPNPINDNDLINLSYANDNIDTLIKKSGNVYTAYDGIVLTRQLKQENEDDENLVGNDLAIYFNYNKKHINVNNNIYVPNNNKTFIEKENIKYPTYHSLQFIEKVRYLPKYKYIYKTVILKEYGKLLSFFPPINNHYLSTGFVIRVPNLPLKNKYRMYYNYNYTGSVNNDKKETIQIGKNAAGFLLPDYLNNTYHYIYKVIFSEPRYVTLINIESSVYLENKFFMNVTLEYIES